jgi:tetratricopeptide (TPR) repeat protein
LSKEALDLARNIKYEKGIADGARSLGFCYGRLSKHDEAIQLFKESLSLYESLNDIDGQSNVIEYLGFTSRNQGDLGAALKFLYRSLLLAEQTASRRTEQPVITNWELLTNTWEIMKKLWNIYTKAYR